MIRRRRVLSIVFVAAAVTACGQQAAEPPPRGASDPVVVFAAGADRAYVADLFAAYTRTTGVPVIVRTGAMDQLAVDVIDNSIDPPADLLWADDVVALHNAAEEGALRPVRSEFIVAAVPLQLRDPDGFWVALSYRIGVIVLAPGNNGLAGPAGYGSLASQEFAGKLCLGSVLNPVNLAVIGVLMDELGVRRAETIVRAWVRNLARGIYADDTRLVGAIRSGDCAASILPSDELLAAGRNARADGVVSIVPPVVALHAEGIGIGRHARNPDGALALLEWLLGDAVLAAHAAEQGAYPATSGAELPTGLDAPAGVKLPSLSALAFASRDAALLAERAGYRD